MTTEMTAPDLLTGALDKGDQSLGDVLKLVLNLDAADTTKTPPVPTNVTLNPEVVQTLRTLVQTLVGLDLPTSRRELTQAELEEFTLALQDANEVKKAVTASEDKLKQVFQNHADVRALADGRVTPATPTNKLGYYVLEDKASMAVPGLAKKVQRTITEPNPVLTDAGLRDLEQRKLITHEEYLKATRQVREPDEVGVMDLVRKRPGLLPFLAEVSKPERAPYNTISLVTNKD